MKAEHKKQKNEENLSDEIWTNVNSSRILILNFNDDNDDSSSGSTILCN